MALLDRQDMTAKELKVGSLYKVGAKNYSTWADRINGSIIQCIGAGSTPQFKMVRPGQGNPPLDTNWSDNKIWMSSRHIGVIMQPVCKLGRI
jgi:hypothetical protein